MRRVLRGLAALLALAGVLIGVPTALLFLGGNPLAGLSQGLDLWQVLTRPVNDQVIVGAVTILGWLVWVAFLASLLAELINHVPARRERQPIRLPGLHFGQQAAAALIVAVVALIATPHLGSSPAAHAEPSTPSHAPVHSAPQHVEKIVPEEVDEKAKESATRTITHTVKAGDWLWTLAEKYYGDGGDWTKIAAANPGMDPDELAIGQKLRITDLPAPDKPSEETTSAKAKAGEDRAHTVVKGESLSEIADDTYGSTAKWQKIYQANRDQIADPDQIEIGQRLTLPDTARAASQDSQIKKQKKKSAAASEEAAGPSAAEGGQTERAAELTKQARIEAQDERQRAADTAAAPSPATPPASSRPAPAAEPSRSVQDTRQPQPTSTSAEGDATTTDQVAVAAATASVGLLLAAGLISGLRRRRARQQQRRQPGQLLPSPSPAAVHTEDLIRGQAAPVAVHDLDQVLTHLAGHCHDQTQPAPELAAARIADTDIHLLLATPIPDGWNSPAGFEILHDGSVLTIGAAAIADLTPRTDMAPPYPALVTLGRDEADAHILVNLESAAALVLTAPDTATATATLTSIALELCMSPWSQDVQMTFVGAVCEGLAAALDSPNVTSVADTDLALAGLERLAATREQHTDDGSTPATRRGDHTLADAWNPSVLLFGDDLTFEQTLRLEQIVAQLPRVAVAAVTTSPVLISGAWRCDLGDQTLTVSPQGWQLTPTPVDATTYAHIVELLTVTDTDTTSPAPWWAHPDTDVEDLQATVTDLSSRRAADSVETDVDDANPLEETADLEHAAVTDETTDILDDVAAVDLSTAAAAPAFTGHRPLVGLGLFEGGLLDNPLPVDRSATTDETDGDDTREQADDDEVADLEAGSPSPEEDEQEVDDLASSPIPAPQLQILGPCTIVGGADTPQRYQQRCMEFMLYLLEHPRGTSTQVLSQVYHLSRGTTRQILAQLRQALGADSDGNLWLPENYNRQGYRLDPRVSSDWHQVQQLLRGGVNNASNEALTQALNLIQGQPLTGADWWEAIEALRPVITSLLVDVAHELTTRTLTHGDIPTARWATSQGLHVDPRNEHLLADRIRTESYAGNDAEVRRLATAVSANARELGVDLLDDTQGVLADAALL